MNQYIKEKTGTQMIKQIGNIHICDSEAAFNAVNIPEKITLKITIKGIFNHSFYLFWGVLNKMKRNAVSTTIIISHYSVNVYT